MVLITSNGPETLPVGSRVPDFDPLPATDGKAYNLAGFKGQRLVVVSFTCNHCPYAQAYEKRFIDLAREFLPREVAFVAINPNDEISYPEDSFEKMIERAKTLGYPFPYLRDATQAVARAFGAVCTPHLFVLNPERIIVYEGRIDDNWRDIQAVKSQDLRNALEALLAGKPVPVATTSPMGCSIKWK